MGRYVGRLCPITMAAAVAALVLSSTNANATPPFARQTGLACEACHTVFPELTPFGRLFKMNGYVFSNVKQIQDINERRERTLSLSELPPIGLQLQASNTTIAKSLPDAGIAGEQAQRNSLQFPQALSLFYTGEIADNLGAFLQVTWDPGANSIGIDNSDLRFANHGSLPAIGAQDFIYGVTVNNNPTSQDVWNSTPAWGFPFIVSAVLPGPNAGTLIDGTLAQQSAGVGGYLYLFNHLYLEVSGYRSFQPGSASGSSTPLDSTAANERISGTAPYWRVAWEQDWERNSVSFGTFGIRADMHPTAVGNHGATDTFTDTAFDVQYQYIGENHIYSLYGTFIHETRDLQASSPGSSSEHLDTFRLTGSYFYNRKIGGSAQIFSTTGTSDPVVFPTAAVTGSANNSPTTQGAVFEIDYLPWLNTKLGLQYTAYYKFNGAKNNYDGSGRNASDNNALFAFVWTAF